MFFGNTETKEKDVPKIKGKHPKSTKGQNIETSIGISIEEGFFGKGKTICLKDEKGIMKNFSFKIPEGIPDKGKIRLNGLGKESKDGGENGDLIISVNFEKNENLSIQDSNLYTNLYITPWEAALGTKVEVKCIDENISIKLPRGVQYGDKIEIKGKGYKNKDGSRGNLIINTKIMIPKTLNSEEKIAIENIEKISKFNPREAKN